MSETDTEFLDRMAALGIDQETWPPLGTSKDEQQRLWDLTHLAISKEVLDG